MSKSGIHIKAKNKGKFNATKKATGKTTEELTHSSNPTTRKRAIFAQNARKWHHDNKAEGGYIPSWDDTEEIYYPEDQAFGGYYPGNYYNTYGFGSWLGRNVGNIAQTIGGAALIATGVGAPIGAGMLASGAGGFGKDAVQQDLENKEAGLNQNKTNVNNAMGRLQQYNQSQRYGGWMANGGYPQGKATMGDAQQYNNQMPNEMEMGRQVESEHTGNKKLQERIAADHLKDNPQYYSQLRQSGISDELNTSNSTEAVGNTYLADEKGKRRNIRDRLHRGKTTDPNILQNVPKQPYTTLKDGMKVFMVDGEYVRNEIDSDFSQGGNDHAYPKYIPKGEIWIDQTLPKGELAKVIKHEDDEQKMMAKGRMYSNGSNGAHDIVKLIEDKSRGEGLGNERKLTKAHIAAAKKAGVSLTPTEEYKNIDAQSQGVDPQAQQASQQLEQQNMQQMAKGGKLNKNKAKQILKDGTIRGKAITDKQRKYFGYISGGGNPKKWGGDLYQNENVHNLDKFSYKHDDGPSGYLKGYAKGGPMDMDSLLQANKNVPFVKKILSGDTTSIQIPGVGGRSTHYMAQSDNIMYPTVQNVNGALQYLGKDAAKNAIKTGNYIEFKNDKDAEYASEHYKDSKAWKEYGKKGNYANGGSFQGKGDIYNYGGYNHGGYPPSKTIDKSGIVKADPTYLPLYYDNGGMMQGINTSANPHLPFMGFGWNKWHTGYAEGFDPANPFGYVPTDYLYAMGGPDDPPKKTPEQNLYSPIVNQAYNTIDYAKNNYTNTSTPEGISQMNNMWRNANTLRRMTYPQDSVLVEPGFKAAGRFTYDEGNSNPVGKWVKRNVPPVDNPDVQAVNNIFTSLTDKQKFNLLDRPYKNKQGEDHISLGDIVNAAGTIGIGNSVDLLGHVRNLRNNGFTQANGGNIYADGGPFMNSLKVDKNMITSYTGGGSHEENRYGGIQVGKNAKVEENEERFDDPETGTSYIFSDRLPYIENKKK